MNSSCYTPFVIIFYNLTLELYLIAKVVFLNFYSVSIHAAILLSSVQSLPAEA